MSAALPPRTDLPSPSPRALASRLARLARKELSETLRDRRTILTLLLMPLLLYPALGLAVWLSQRGVAAADAAPTYRIGFASQAEGEAIRVYLSYGEQLLVQEGVFSPPGEPPAAPAPGALPLPKLTSLLAPDLEDQVRSGAVDVGLRTRPPGGFAVNTRRNLALDWEAVYREDSPAALEALRHVQRLTDAGSLRFLADRVALLGERQRRLPVVVEPVPLPRVGDAPPSTLLALVPLILILMTITGAVYPAIDLTAGERERGTLEILMAAPVPRLSLLLAKYAAVVAVAVLTALVNLGAMAATLLTLRGLGSLPAGGDGLSPTRLAEAFLSPLVLAEVFLLLLLFAAFFSAVLLALTSFARSFKEAQAYLIPLMLLSLVPGTLGLVPDLNLQGPLLVVPLLNVVLLARDLLAHKAEPLSALIVVASTLVYALGAIVLAARLFGADAVRGDQRGWFARRRRKPAES